MAIQQINLGSMPLGAGGDTQRAANTKINQNFSNSAHAANRLVGEAATNVMEVGAFGLGSKGTSRLQNPPNLKDMVNGYFVLRHATASIPGLPTTPYPYTGFVHNMGSGAAMLSMPYPAVSELGRGYQFIVTDNTGAVIQFANIYTDKNTTIEENTNYLKVSSPVLRLKHDDFEKEHEAEQMNIEVTNPNTGVYKVTGTTGLRSDGWYFSPPKDEHNNVLCICEATESNGVITLRTYKKKFDFETVAIVADYEQPTDIPEGAVVMLRFNDLPQEQLDEPIE